MSFKENKNKKEIEYRKLRAASQKQKNLKILSGLYRVFYYFLLMAFLIVSIYTLFFSPFMLIDDVQYAGIQDLNPSEISLAGKNVYMGNYLGFIPKNNFLLFPERILENSLLENFKRIKNVEIVKKFPNSVNIIISERKSLLLWCDQSDECFIVDENGFAYDNVSLDSKEVLENNLVKIISLENRKLSEGEKIIDSEKVQFFLNLKEIIKKGSDMDIGGEIFIKSRMAEEVTVKATDGWDLYINTTFPLDQGVKMLKLFLEKQTDSELKKKMEYVDLRVENRLYYKFKKEEGVQEEEVVAEKEADKL